MTLYDAIFERHSVRDYLEQPFPREIRYDLGEKQTISVKKVT